jgi:ankyrin repeat protein
MVKTSKESEMNIGVALRPEEFAESSGIFPSVANGALTDIVDRFTCRDQPLNKNDILQLLVQQDNLGRTPLDIACHLNFKNIALYLMVKSGDANEYIQQEVNIDKEGRSLYHVLGYRGNYDVLTTMLNYERVCLKKVISDMLTSEMKAFNLKNLDIKHGELVSTTYHSADQIRKHADFNMRVTNLFERYTNMILDRYRSVLLLPDEHGRNPLHYAAMSKFTSCYRCV